MKKIGIDFGNTIGKIEEKSNYENLNIIKMFVEKYTPNNVFIISKAKQEMRTKIQSWLSDNSFFELTNFKKDNVYFVNDYLDKKDMIIKLGITIFIDDHYKVINSLFDLDSMICLIWFNKKADINLIPKRYKHKIIITHKWNRIWNQKWNK